MNIKYDIEIPKSASEDVNALYDFISGDKKTMCITYETERDAKNRKAVLARAIEKEKLGCKVTRIGCDVFIGKENSK